MSKCVKFIVAIALLGLTTARSYNGFHQHGQGYGRHDFDHDSQFHFHGRWPCPPNFHNHGHIHPKPDDYQFHNHGQFHPKPYDHQPRLDYDKYWPNDFARWDPSWVFPDQHGFPEPWVSTTSMTTDNPVSSTSLAVELCLRSCSVTPEYNPVCGTDNVTYSNPGRLECAKYCGVDVELKRLSPCKRPDTTDNINNEDQNTPVVNPLNIDNQPTNDQTTKRPNDPDSTIPNEVLDHIFTTEDAPDIDIRFPEKGSIPQP